MIDAQDRCLPFERCFNFRDLGGYTGRDGYTVRWRRFYRSMTPQYMSPADADAVATLNIGLVIDFRGERFPSSGPLPAPGGVRLALSPAPRTDADRDRDPYLLMPPEEGLVALLERYGRQYAQALTAIAGSGDAGILFHCRLGKDRTGVFAALLLKLLGVNDDDIVLDYMITREQEPLVRGLLAEVEAETPPNEPNVAKLPADSRAMYGVLQRVSARYGGAHGYFSHQGVAPETIAVFVDNALEAPPPARHP